MSRDDKVQACKAARYLRSLQYNARDSKHIMSRVRAATLSSKLQRIAQSLRIWPPGASVDFARDSGVLWAQPQSAMCTLSQATLDSSPELVEEWCSHAP